MQAVVNHHGLTTKVATGVPGGMPDAAAYVDACVDDCAFSTMVDDSY